MDLPIADYFVHAYRLTDTEIRIRDSLMEWLPNQIIDAHAHCNLAEHIDNINERTLEHMLSTFPYLSLEDSKQLHNLLFPKKIVRSLRFAHVFPAGSEQISSHREVPQKTGLRFLGFQKMLNIPIVCFIIHGWRHSKCTGRTLILRHR